MKRSTNQKHLTSTVHTKDNWQNFSTDILKNKAFLKKYLGASQDIIFTKFEIKMNNNIHLNAILVAIDGLVDENAKRNNIIKPLIDSPLEPITINNLHTIKSRLSVKNIITENNLVKAANEVLKAHVLIFIDGESEGLLIPIEEFEIRSITEPETEQVVRGAREGFIEETSVNLSMIRRKIAHPALRFDSLEIGKYSKTNITIAYIQDIADPELIQRVKQKFQQIKVDAINGSGQVEQLIEDNSHSIFPTIGNTERPDKAAFLLMEGRILIFVNGDPVSLFVPFQFVESIKNIEDYNSRPYYTSFIRLIRFFAFGLSITLPAFYIAAVNFNKALIPSDLIVPLAAAREAVPFPLALEVIIMIMMFEVVREAGVRLPNQIGTAVGIVGPLILGEVAVSSALVGAPTVIVVSISYIAAFVITPIADVTALLRIALFVTASIFGTYGITIFLLAIITHMVSLTSIGVPYMAPFSPLHFRDWKDALVRFPTKFLKYRLNSIPNKRSKKLESLPDSEDKK